MPDLKVFLSKADVADLEIDYVVRAMRSGWVAPAGPDLDAFEAEIAQRVGVAHGVGLGSGTAALHLALVSWGVQPGDLVITSTLTFAATANAATYVGADLHFVDCDPQTGNMDPDLLDQALRSARAAGRRVGAVIPVDMLGEPVEYDAIMAVADEYGVRLLCDAAESFGASYRGKAAGSFGDASVLSFNGNKVMTTSGGGMLLTNDGDLAAHVRKLSTQAREDVPWYEHQEIGYNYRLSNVLAALGRAQLRRLDEMVERRAAWRERYRSILEVPGVRFLGGTPDAVSNAWLTAIVVDESVAGWAASDLGKALAARGIETRPLWKPMHQQPVFARCSGTLSGAADDLFANGLALPSGSGLTDGEFELVESAVRSFVGSR